MGYVVSLGFGVLILGAVLSWAASRAARFIRNLTEGH